MIKGGEFSSLQRRIVFFVVFGVTVAVVLVSCDGGVSRSGFKCRQLPLSVGRVFAKKKSLRSDSC